MRRSPYVNVPQTDLWTLPAMLLCNQRLKEGGGISFCQEWIEQAEGMGASLPLISAGFPRLTLPRHTGTDFDIMVISHGLPHQVKT